MNPKKNPVVFGRVCPHCHAPHQVYGMKCLECHKYIFTNFQVGVIFTVMIIAAIALFAYASQFPLGKEIVGLAFIIAFGLTMRKMFR